MVDEAMRQVSHHIIDFQPSHPSRTTDEELGRDGGGGGGGARGDFGGEVIRMTSHAESIESHLVSPKSGGSQLVS